MFGKRTILIFAAICLVLSGAIIGISATSTSLGLVKPAKGDLDWLATFNTNFQKINNLFTGAQKTGGINASGLSINGVPVGTSTDTYWSVDGAGEGGIGYASAVTVGGEHLGKTRTGIDTAIAASAKSVSLTADIVLESDWDLSAYTGRFATNGHQISGAFTFTAPAGFVGSDNCFGPTLTVIFTSGLGQSETAWFSSIQAAVNAAEASTVVIPLHFVSTDITDSIVLAANKAHVFFGDGYQQTTIKATDTMTAMFSFPDAAAGAHVHVVFKDMHLNGNGKADYGIYAPFADTTSGLSHAWMERIYVSGTLVYGIFWEYGWCVDVTECWVGYNTGGGIYAAQSANAVNIVNTKIGENSGVGIFIDGGASVRVEGCTIEANAKGGLKLEAISAPNIVGNYFENNGNTNAGENFSISLSPTKASCIGGSVSNNYIRGKDPTTVGSSGIVLGYVVGTRIAGNYFRYLTNAFDNMSPATTVPQKITVENNEFETATIGTIWKASAANEQYLSRNLNKIRIPGLFDTSSGNLLHSNPVSWPLNSITGTSTIGIVAGHYPSWTMKRDVGDTCYVRMSFDTTSEYEYLRGKYVTFGVRAKASTAGILNVVITGTVLGTVSNAINILTTPTTAYVTAFVPTNETTLYVIAYPAADGYTYTGLDYFLTLGTEIPQQSYKTYYFRSGAGDPTASVVPLYIGEEYLNTTGNHWYKAHGTTAADWTALN